ncbi:PCYCGC motif-containing (lipo)protein [Alkalihalobacillus sp. BA299]|uniref:PCYCGC motif-containing (lipo)protein n=1 Tax=Alkalihalobacillus sp. BA299 TaxID=2815938 RepID=UPI001ADBFF41|nr:PCYCGC motif-containing (lipo)protein [Alkalihalobacillus sp. BA299]
MKKVIFPFLIFFIVLVGCSNKEEAILGPSQETIQMLSQEAQKIDVTLPDFVEGRPNMVKENYALSSKYSNVLENMPCFCGCVNQGHESNFNCFIKEKNGEDIVWDQMSLNCDICNGIARESIALYKEGNSLYQIRTYIDDKYGDYGPSTNTPMPPENM